MFSSFQYSVQESRSLSIALFLKKLKRHQMASKEKVLHMMMYILVSYSLLWVWLGSKRLCLTSLWLLLRYSLSFTLPFNLMMWYRLSYNRRLFFIVVVSLLRIPKCSKEYSRSEWGRLQDRETLFYVGNCRRETWRAFLIFKKTKKNFLQF